MARKVSTLLPSGTDTLASLLARGSTSSSTIATNNHTISSGSTSDAFVKVQTDNRIRGLLVKDSGQFGLYDYDNSAFRLQIDSNGNVTVPQNLTISGDFTVTGTSTTLSAETLIIDDPMLHLAHGNETADIVDIGFIGHYSDDGGTTKKHTGLFRDASNQQYYVFNAYVDSGLDSSVPTSTINRSDATFALAALNGSALNAGVQGSTSGTVTAFGDGSSNGGTLKVETATSAEYVRLKGGASGDITLTLPTTVGSADQAITSNGSGVLSFSLKVPRIYDSAGTLLN
jgi:hypothetical protein